ncbi:MAG: AAA family ATPase, partial [Methanospirillum sp.]|nr:AAA family ATPase [Methanospirillum sp.]
MKKAEDILIHEGKETCIYLHEGYDCKERYLYKLLNGSSPPAAKQTLSEEYRITQEISSEKVRKAITQKVINGQDALILEYIEGEPLSSYFENTPRTNENFLKVAIETAESVVRLHDMGYMHKNLTGENLLLESASGHVIIIDLGMAERYVTSRFADPAFPQGSLSHIAPEQTGRMNRGYDTRADLYALGVTFYHLLTGKLPFKSSEPLELIHSHLARSPPPLSDLNPEISAQISDILMHLLEKDPDARYQTAYGLLYDLTRCHDNLKASGRIDHFQVGVHDYSGELRFPKKLYGRDLEQDQVQGIFAKVRTGESELLLVNGYSGVGKTTLVNEIKPVVFGFGGFYVEGKYDQFLKNSPYAGWISALTALVYQFLMMNDEDLKDLSERIQDAVGTIGNVLTNLIPDLEHVIGTQPPVPELGGREASNRFNYVFQRFITSVASPEHPLVVFLDDLQWVDTGSLELLDTLMNSPGIRSFLVIGAYRDNEVGVDHPLA